MGLFRSKASAAADATALNYLASAPPGPRAEVLASAIVLQVAERPVAGSARYGEVPTLEELAEVDELARKLLYQDDDFAAAVTRKLAVYANQLQHFSKFDDVEAWLGCFLGANGCTLGISGQVEVVGGEGIDSDGRVVADLFWMVFRAVAFGNTNKSTTEWGFYSSLYTDSGKHELNYSIISWASLAHAKLRNSGFLVRPVPSFGDEYRSIPPLQGPGWYPYPTKSTVLASGDAAVKCYWDGQRWTDRCRISEGNSWSDMTRSPHAPPVD